MLAGSVGALSLQVISRLILPETNSYPLNNYLLSFPDPSEVPNVGSLGSFGALAWEATRALIAGCRFADAQFAGI